MNDKQRKLWPFVFIILIQTAFLYVRTDYKTSALSQKEFCLKYHVDSTQIDQIRKDLYGERIVYDLFPTPGSNAQVTIVEYVYYATEHLAWIYWFFLITYYEIRSLKRELIIMLIISIIDFGDYLLTYNRVYYEILSWNLITAFILFWMLLSARDPD